MANHQNDYKQPHNGQTIHEQLQESNKRKRDLSTHNTLFKVPSQGESKKKEELNTRNKTIER
jgi:hypothetical protein